VGDQGPLADRRHRLLLGHVGGAGLAGQLHAAGAHRAAAHQRDLDLFLSQRRDLRRDGSCVPILTTTCFAVASRVSRRAVEDTLMDEAGRTRGGFSRRAW